MRCLFFLDVRLLLQNPVWSVYPESGYCLLRWFPAFLDIIYSMCQVTVFKLVCPKKVFRKVSSVNILYVIFGAYLHVFSDHGFLNSTFFVALLSLLCACIKCTGIGVRLTATLDSSPPHPSRPSEPRPSRPDLLKSFEKSLEDDRET